MDAEVKKGKKTTGCIQKKQKVPTKESGEYSGRVEMADKATTTPFTGVPDSAFALSDVSQRKIIGTSSTGQLGSQFTAATSISAQGSPVHAPKEYIRISTETYVLAARNTDDACSPETVGAFVSIGHASQSPGVSSPPLATQTWNTEPTKPMYSEQFDRSRPPLTEMASNESRSQPHVPPTNLLISTKSKSGGEMPSIRSTEKTCTPQIASPDSTRYNSDDKTSTTFKPSGSEQFSLKSAKSGKDKTSLSQCFSSKKGPSNETVDGNATDKTESKCRPPDMKGTTHDSLTTKSSSVPVSKSSPYVPNNKGPDTQLTSTDKYDTTRKKAPSPLERSGTGFAPSRTTDGPTNQRPSLTLHGPKGNLGGSGGRLTPSPARGSPSRPSASGRLDLADLRRLGTGSNFGEPPGTYIPPKEYPQPTEAGCIDTSKEVPSEGTKRLSTTEGLRASKTKDMVCTLNANYETCAEKWRRGVVGEYREVPCCAPVPQPQSAPGSNMWKPSVCGCCPTGTVPVPCPPPPPCCTNWYFVENRPLSYPQTHGCCTRPMNRYLPYQHSIPCTPNRPPCCSDPAGWEATKLPQDSFHYQTMTVPFNPSLVNQKRESINSNQQQSGSQRQLPYTNSQD